MKTSTKSPAKPASGKSSSKNAGTATAKKSAATKGRSASSKKSTPKKSASAKDDSNPKMESDSMLLDFFCDELKDIYWAEKHLVKTLPKMAKAATSPELAKSFTDHLAETKQQVIRLEQCFELLGKKARAKKCEAMEGITKEGQGVIEDTKAGTATRDVGLVLAGQKVEHYEISTYGGLAQLAHTLGQEKVAAILEATLEEEKQADGLLTQIAKQNINYQASTETGKDN